MAATQTVHQIPQPLNSSIETARPLAPRHGVVTLFGYGVSVRVDRGHLMLKDGIGAARREARLPRVGHGLRRLVVIGADGMVSLAALRWLADQDASFVMLDRDGSVLATTGPVRPSDARLRRAQALAHHSGAALRIVRELIGQKLAGQERLASDSLRNPSAAQKIAQARAAVTTADTIESIRLLEGQAAHAYWSAWCSVPITFPRIDVRRIPDHWRTFGTRRSPLSGSPRLAVNPPNAILNYLYAVLESEARLGSVNTNGHNHVTMRRWNSRKLNTNGSRHTCRCSAATSAFRTSRCSTPSCMSPSMAANGAGYPHGLATGTPSTPA